MRALPFLVLLAAGCFNPSFDEPTCDPGGPCPDGLSCIDGVCRMPDDQPDAAPGDCYDEADEAGNDDTAESTEIVIGDAPRRVCGELAEREPSGGIIDIDRYQIDGGGQPLRVRISAPGGDAYGSLLLTLGAEDIIVNTDPDVLEVAMPVGPAELRLQASHPQPIGTAVPYEMVIEPLPPDPVCVAPGTPDHTEALDSAANAHTGNDVVTGLLPGPTMLTPAPEDAPEEVTAVLVGGTIGIVGTAVNTPTPGDMYKDRDTYRVTTGPATTEIMLQLTWPEDAGTTTDDADIDFYFFTEGLERIAQGVQVGFGTYESALITVSPSTTYYVVVATYMDAQADKTYDLLLCANDP